MLNIAEFFHNYPQQWTFVDECARCHGSGTVMTTVRGGLQQEDECSSCGGTGQGSRKDVTDIIKLKKILYFLQFEI